MHSKPAAPAPAGPAITAADDPAENVVDAASAALMARSNAIAVSL